MPSFHDLIQQGASHAWLFIPTAILLGALHGLEPGHSKTMMAAFIIAIRGTIAQAVLLGLSAAVSHSLIIWLLAAAALKLGSHWNAESTEPYFQIASGLIILGMAAWMFFRTRRDVAMEKAHAHEHHHHGEDGGQWVETREGAIEVTVFEDGVPPRFRLKLSNELRAAPRTPVAEEVHIETIRRDGSRQSFSFVAREDFFEAVEELPEPHEFEAVLRIRRELVSEEHAFSFHEHRHHEGAHADGEDFQDAHEQAHAADIARRFTDRKVTTAQIVLFGLTGGLLPCPAALTVLLVCLQLKELTLGFALVLAFSFGLAITMVSIGAAAAWGVQHASRKIKTFGSLARRAPYFSSAVLVVLGLYILFMGWSHLH